MISCHSPRSQGHLFAEPHPARAWLSRELWLGEGKVREGGWWEREHCRGDADRLLSPPGWGKDLMGVLPHLSHCCRGNRCPQELFLVPWRCLGAVDNLSSLQRLSGGWHHLLVPSTCTYYIRQPCPALCTSESLPVVG